MELDIHESIEREGGEKLNYWQLLYCTNFGIRPTQMREHLLRKLNELYAYGDNPKNFDMSKCQTLHLFTTNEKSSAENKPLGIDYDIKDEAEAGRILSNIHQAEYQKIVRVLKNSDIPPEFVALLLNETITKVYNYADHDLDKAKTTWDRVAGQTTENHMVLNMSTVPEIMKNLRHGKGFTDAYFDSMDEYQRQKQTTWVKLPDGWEKTRDGDYYTYKDIRGNARVAVEVCGNAVNEVCGDITLAEGFLRANSNLSGVTAWLNEIEVNERFEKYNRALTSKNFNLSDIENLVADLDKPIKQYGGNQNRARLIENLRAIKPQIAKHFDLPEKLLSIHELEQSPKHWIESVQSMKGIMGEYQKITSGKFQPADTWSLVKVLGKATSLGNDYDHLAKVRNSLMKILPSVKNDMAKYFSVQPNDILIGNLDMCDLKTLNTKVVFGSVTDTKAEIPENKYKQYQTHFDKPAHPSKTLKYVVGDVNIANGFTRELNNLHTCFGDLDISGKTFKSAPKLFEVYGKVNIDNAQIEDLAMLKTVKNGLHIENSAVRSLASLAETNGAVEIEKSQIDSMGRLKSMPELTIINSRIPENFKPTEVAGDVTAVGYLDLTSLKSCNSINIQGGLDIDPAIDTDVITYFFRDYNVQEFIKLRAKQLERKDKTQSKNIANKRVGDISPTLGI